MAKTRAQKKEVFKKVVDLLGKAKAAVVVNFKKLTVSDDQKLRKKMKEAGVKYEVIKKTVLKKSLAEAKIDAAEMEKWQGNIALAISLDDEIKPAKIAQEFSKEKKEDYVVVGGLFQGAWVGREKVLALAALPSKEELLAKVVGSLNAPLSGFVNVLAGNIRGLVNVFNAIKDKK